MRYQLLPPQKRADWLQSHFSVWTKKPLSGEYASHFGLELRWRNSSPLVGSSNRPTSHSAKGFFFFFSGWKFQSIPELVVHQMFFGQRNIVQQTPEMNDMMILRDNFCTDCGQQGGLTSIPSGTFFDQQKAEVETRTFFVSLKTNHGFLAKVYKDSELKKL